MGFKLGVGRKGFMDDETKEERFPVLVLAQLTEKSLEGTRYAYRVADGAGTVAVVDEEKVFKSATDEVEETTGEAEEKSEEVVDSEAESV